MNHSSCRPVSARQLGTPRLTQTRRMSSRVRCMADDHAEQARDPQQFPQSPAADALIKSMQDLSSRMESRPQSSNLVLGVEGSEAAWRRLDQQVNVYPLQRDFKAIGTGGEDFREAMVAAVEKVIGKVHVECISERVSTEGKYNSVTIGPVWVENADQVVKVYSLMRADSRLKYYI